MTDSTPLSASFRTPTIWLSLYCDRFIDTYRLNTPKSSTPKQSTYRGSLRIDGSLLLKDLSEAARQTTAVGYPESPIEKVEKVTHEAVVTGRLAFGDGKNAPEAPFDAASGGLRTAQAGKEKE